MNQHSPEREFEPLRRKALPDFAPGTNLPMIRWREVAILDAVAPRLTPRGDDRVGLMLVYAERLPVAFDADLKGVGQRLALCPDAPLTLVQRWRAYDLGDFRATEILKAIGEPDPLASLASGDHGARLYALAGRRHGLSIANLDQANFARGARRPAPRGIAGLKAARLEIDGNEVTVIAPPLGSLLVDLKALQSQTRTRLATPRQLEACLTRLVAKEVAAESTGALRSLDPPLSAAATPNSWQKGLIGAGFLGAAVNLWQAPIATLTVLSLLSTLGFLAIGWQRTGAAMSRLPEPHKLPIPNQRFLPGYTVLVPLYHEANMVAGLVEALETLDYPRDRLDIRILTEADDLETAHAAIDATRGLHHFRVMVVPPGKPRTKPRALCYGLAFARGELVTVYDAEDRPEPDQLLRAAAAFDNGPPHLACVQARLEIDGNVTALQHQFALEYLSLFGGLLPFLAARSSPLPLGGTSNHFKRAALDQVGGWDPNNVTEDADLGIRLARYGFSTDMLDSRTLEEAPASPAVWYRQRRRWIKGWLVTALVHGRNPRVLAWEIGRRNAAMLYLQFLAMIVAPMAHPIGFGLILLYVTGQIAPPFSGSLAGTIMLQASLIGMGFGYAGSFWLAGSVIRKHRRADLRRQIWLMPFYWLLISIAAWSALADLMIRPRHWSKTPHRRNEAGTRKGRTWGRFWSG